ncbi:hypothetical protein AB0B89_29540 [Sphaerisporangium sp. NPDC049002]|uniref:hypothetical protein n=1 Tax=Sphaerisporangium sp. NPDC049002 TaxID=3155392 RepID=UPI0033CB5469
MTDCLSPHLPLPQSGCERLTWLPPVDATRVRVVAWTCDCRAVFFELCEAGGMAFVRRTVQRNKRPEITETHRMRVRHAWDLWTSLLSGMAR